MSFKTMQNGGPMSRIKLVLLSLLLAASGLWTPSAFAESMFEEQILGSLRLVRAAAMSMKCDLVDETTRMKALFNLRAAMRRQQLKSHVSDTDAQIEARIDAAIAEGEAVRAERCDWFKRRPDEAARQTEIIEMLAYGTLDKVK